ncbi:hypothetical protein OBV_24990 [Oscillibacter valericigenes Sjm18-20]|nr:hypothetical protein OBV_24990 [Oscillibacter valericigenes Sjm18-20]
MGKCILAGHPPVGGQIGYGTYTGDGAASRTISLGVTPKWVLVLMWGSTTINADNHMFGGLATFNSPATNVGGLIISIKIVSGGFYIQNDDSRAYTNFFGYKYNYIYGT